VIGAGQRGLDAYADYALKNPHELKVVAVAEPMEARRLEAATLHGIPDERVFKSWEELLAGERLADAALVCTQDREHFEPARLALEKGYDVLVEKPMSPDPRECLEMGRMAERLGRTLSVCHVLRYSPFFAKVKEILDSGVIGQIASIQHIENVGYWHQAHSFVRGNWRNSKETSPMILAKSCHDMDILRWLAGSKCVSVSSFGGLMHFKPENAPKGAPSRCLDGCPAIGECPYSAAKIYLQDDEWQSDLIRRIICGSASKSAALEAVKTGPYGRCVYFCDNDVVDHQAVNLEFESGATASFTMCGFTACGGRDINIMGTKGQILGKMEENWIEVQDFLTGEKTRRLLAAGSAAGHSGSDPAMMRSFVRQLRGLEEGKTAASESVESHLIALAAERSRKTCETVKMADYEASL
jgi:predicted dehydrogenase